MVPGFTLEEVLVYTRLAADAVQPTRMDRPEDVEPNLHNGSVYVACTNNTDRGKVGKEGPTEPNPRAGQQGRPRRRDHPDTRRPHGRHVRLEPVPHLRRRRLGRTYFGGWTGPVSPISCPDNVAFDSVGNLWVSTDGQPSAIKVSDGLFKVPVEGPERGHVQQFLAVPSGAETCGPVIRDRDDSVFVAVQHPGEDGIVGRAAVALPRLRARRRGTRRRAVRRPAPDGRPGHSRARSALRSSHAAAPHHHRRGRGRVDGAAGPGGRAGLARAGRRPRRQLLRGAPRRLRSRSRPTRCPTPGFVVAGLLVARHAQRRAAGRRRESRDRSRRSSPASWCCSVRAPPRCTPRRASGAATSTC